MKKTRFFIPLVTSTVVASLTPLTILSSCGAKYNEQTNELFNQAIDLFMGTEQQKGICQVPHASFHLDEMIKYLSDFVSKAGYTINRDDYGNLWWDIPATKGCENWKPLVLQGHMDMVWTEAKNNPNSDMIPKPVFDTDKGEKIIHTENYSSSLGADDGNGLAILMALTINKNIKHGKLRCIATADEEPGMVGAAVIGQRAGQSTINVVSHDEGWDYLLNIDGESEKEIYVSCAGGYSYKYTIGKFDLDSIVGTQRWTLTVNGCQGGHSGLAIAKGHANAVKIGVDIMGYINNYLELNNQKHAQLISINSFENATNVVPNKAEITFACSLDATSESFFNEYLKSVVYAYKQIYPAEEDLNIEVKHGTETVSDAISIDESDTILNFVDYFVYGLVAQTEEGRPIASSNICPVTLDLTKSGAEDEEQFEVKIYSRSEDEELLKSFIDIAYTNYHLLFERLKNDAKVHDINDEPISQYDPYKYKEDDKVRALIQKAYKRVGLNADESRIHGGIECSWWYKLNPQIHQTAIGPNIDDVHDPKETLHLDSYKKIVSAVLDLIAGMKNI